MGASQTRVNALTGAASQTRFNALTGAASQTRVNALTGAASQTRVNALMGASQTRVSALMAGSRGANAMQSFSVLKPVTLGLLGFLALNHDGHRAFGAERVQFESARYQVGQLQLRLARERGETTTRPPADLIDGYLARPQGQGPFPAIIHLHGCGGLPEAYKARASEGFWAEQLDAWGYVVLSVDSFTARGITNTCMGTLATRAADAVGALTYLGRQPFVDPSRIALIGFAAGGGATLSAMEARDFELFENEDGPRFKAAIAFYPHCASHGAMSAPTLILSANWTIGRPRRLARRCWRGGPQAARPDRRLS